MRYFDRQTATLKRISLTMLVLFALAPCTVKVGLFDAIEVTYAQPLNKSRAVATTFSGCSAAPLITASQNQSDVKKPIRPAPDFCRWQADTPNVTVSSLYFHTAVPSGKTPPKYILFKRLKLDAAA
ncbi:hypothetical protein [Parapedobacter soli]|uniref:hypothetical protein n=1 Tax=Parapedobacter soli TaxID=416955 RepID=UPI0021C8D6E0|nr:hypothetical protein [Parapedobacter soli]